MREREYKRLCEAIRLHTTDSSDDWEPAMDILMSLRNQHIKERRKTVRPKRAVQQRKVSTVRSCGNCGDPACFGTGNKSICKSWGKRRKAKTVA